SPSSREAGYLLSTLSWFAGLRDYDTAHDAIERSHVIARRLGDGALERRAVVNDAPVDFLHLRGDGRLDTGPRALALAGEADDRRTEMAARSLATRMYTNLGEPEKAAAHTAGMLEQAERFRERYWLVTARINPLWLAVLMGDWATARELSDQAL